MLQCPRRFVNRKYFQYSLNWVQIKVLHYIPSHYKWTYSNLSVFRLIHHVTTPCLIKFDTDCKDFLYFSLFSWRFFNHSIDKAILFCSFELVFLIVIFSPRVVLHLQTWYWAHVRLRSEMHSLSCLFRDQLQGNNSLLPFFLMTHSQPTALKKPLLIIFSFAHPFSSSCILLVGRSDCKLLVIQSPHCALQCQHASCLSRELGSLSHCYFGSSMCLSNWGSGFLVLRRESACFGLQRSHDGQKKCAVLQLQ